MATLQGNRGRVGTRRPGGEAVESAPGTQARGATPPRRQGPIDCVEIYHGGMTATHAHELPPESGGELILTAEEITSVERDGEIVILTRGGRPVAKVHAIDPDQAWFWTPEWQAREREIEGEGATGIRDREFDFGDDFLAYLKAVTEDPLDL